MSTKERLTVTIDRELVAAGSAAVARGAAESLSAWVNLALSERAEKEARLRALGTAVAAYEREFGELRDDEIRRQQRRDRAAARVARGRQPVRRRRGSRRTA